MLPGVDGCQRLPLTYAAFEQVFDKCLGEPAGPGFAAGAGRPTAAGVALTPLLRRPGFSEVRADGNAN